MRIDASALGISREKHHRYLNDSTLKGIFLYERCDCIGYESSTPRGLGAFLKEQLKVSGTVAREAGLQAH